MNKIGDPSSCFHVYLHLFAFTYSHYVLYQLLNGLGPTSKLVDKPDLELEGETQHHVVPTP